MFPWNTPQSRIPPAPTRTFLEQLVDFRVDDLGWELLGEIRDARGHGASDMPFRAAAVAWTPSAIGPTGPRALPASRKESSPCAISASRRRLRKRTAPAQEKGGLEQAGLARGIRPR